MCSCCWLANAHHAPPPPLPPCSLALDNQNVPYLAYVDASVGLRAVVRRYVCGTWSLVGSAPLSPGIAHSTSLALASTGHPWVAYVSQSEVGWLARYDGTAWVRQRFSTGTVHTSSEIATRFSFALGAGDQPHIALRDSADPAHVAVLRG